MKKLLGILALAGLLVLVVLLAWALAGSTHATQSAASAAKQSSLAVTVLTLLLAAVLVSALLGFVILNWRYRRLSRDMERQAQRAARASQEPGGRWVSGPHANWGRSALPAENGMQQSLQQLIALQLLQQLRQLGDFQQSSQEYLPIREERGVPAEEEQDVYWGW